MKKIDLNQYDNNPKYATVRPIRLVAGEGNIYHIQEYRVFFAVNHTIDVSVYIYREDDTLLSDSEIIDEALGYLDEGGV